MNRSIRNTFIFIVGAFLGVFICHFIFLNELSKRFSLSYVLSRTFNVESSINKYEHDLSDELFHKVKILCWIMISPEFHQTRGVHIKNTWGKKCNKLLFMSSEYDADLGTIVLPETHEKKNHLWSKTKKSFQFIHDHHLNDYDWFMKADDDTFMIMENVREMLHQYRAQTSLYFGYKMVGNESINGFMQGGSYILSKKAVEKFVKLYPNCRQKDAWAEDLYMGELQYERVPLLKPKFQANVSQTTLSTLILVTKVIKNVF